MDYKKACQTHLSGAKDIYETMNKDDLEYVKAIKEMTLQNSNSICDLNKTVLENHRDLLDIIKQQNALIVDLMSKINRLETIIINNKLDEKGRPTIDPIPPTEKAIVDNKIE